MPISSKEFPDEDNSAEKIKLSLVHHKYLLKKKNALNHKEKHRLKIMKEWVNSKIFM